MKRCVVPKVKTLSKDKVVPTEWTTVHGTDGIFAVAYDGNSDKYLLTHVPTGYVVLWCDSKHDAYVKGWLLGQRIDKSIWSSRSVARLRKYGSNALVRRMLSTDKWE